MEFKRQIGLLRNQAGQSTVEYILLFSVIISLVSAVLKSDMFNKIFGEDGKFAQEFRKEIEYSYRHGIQGRALLPESINYGDAHDSYVRPGGGETRFFGAREKYP